MCRNNNHKKIKKILEKISIKIGKLENLLEESVCSCYEKGCECRCWEPCKCTIKNCDCECCTPEEELEDLKECICDEEGVCICGADVDEDDDEDYEECLGCLGEEKEEENLANDIIFGTKKVYADKIINIIIASNNDDL